MAQRQIHHTGRSRPAGMLHGSKRRNALQKGIIVGAMVVSLLTAGLIATTAQAASAAAPSVYKLGYFTDLTGNGGALMPWDADITANVKAINAQGGIKGHKIDLVTCDGATNANGAASCGQQLVADHVFAVIDLSLESSQIPYFQKAGIPDFNIGSMPNMATSPISFMVNDLTVAAGAGFATLAKQADCKSIVYLQDTVSPASEEEQNAAILKDEAIHVGLAYKGTVIGQSSVPDTAPYVQQALKTGADCVAVNGLGAPEVSMLSGLEASSVKVLTASTFVSAPSEAASLKPVIANLGKRLVLLTATEDSSDKSNPQVKAWVHDQTTYGPSPAYLESVSETYWASLQLAVKAADAVYPKVTSTKVLKYLNTVKDYNPGVSPVVSFSKKPPANPFGPRVFAAYVAPAKYANDGSNFPVTGSFTQLVTPGKY